MDLDFTSEQQMLRKSVAEFLAKECPFETVKELEDSDTGYSPQLWKKMAQLGWMEACIPEAYGGSYETLLDMMILMEEMGKKAFPSPFFSTVVLCAQIIALGGSEKQKKDLLPKIASGKLIMALAQLESEGSYLASGITLPAQPSSDGYVLNGVKLFVQDANVADKLIVAARVEGAGATLFLVDAKADGVTCNRLPTIGKDNTCQVFLKDVRVAGSDMIGRPGEGWEILEKVAPAALVVKCAEMLGGCQTSIDMTAAYAKQRVQYDTPIGGFQAIQHYMADMKIAYDTSVNYLYKVAWMVDEGMDAVKETSALKAQVNEKYKFITERAVQIHGGIGTTREFNIGLFYRRAKAFEYVMGDTDYHCERVAPELGL